LEATTSLGSSGKVGRQTTGLRSIAKVGALKTERNEKLAKLGRDDELGKLREGRKADDGIAKHSKGRSPEDTTDRKADDELAKLVHGDSEPALSVTSTKFKRLTRYHRLQITRESEIVADILRFKRNLIRYRDARLGK
jgi:hypothetical protein